MRPRIGSPSWVIAVTLAATTLSVSGLAPAGADPVDVKTQAVCYP